MSHHSNYVYNYPLPIPGEDVYSYYGHVDAHGHRQPAIRPPYASAVPRTTISPADLTRKSTHFAQSSMQNASTRYGDHNNANYALSNQSHVTPSRQAPPRRTTNCGAMADDYSYMANPTGTSNENTTSPGSKDGSHSIQITRLGSQRYYCDFKECFDEKTGKQRSVGRKADLRRHMLTVHGTPTIDCPRHKCWRTGENGFCRKDHRDEHLRGYHNEDVPNKSNRSRDDN